MCQENEFHLCYYLLEALTHSNCVTNLIVAIFNDDYQVSRGTISTEHLLSLQTTHVVDATVKLQKTIEYLFRMTIAFQQYLGIYQQWLMTWKCVNHQTHSHTTFCSTLLCKCMTCIDKFKNSVFNNVISSHVCSVFT